MEDKNDPSSCRAAWKTNINDLCFICVFSIISILESDVWVSIFDVGSCVVFQVVCAVSRSVLVFSSSICVRCCLVAFSFTV